MNRRERTLVVSHHCKETILTTAIDPANEKKRGSGKVQQNNRIVDAKYLLVREEAFSGNRWRERERQREMVGEWEEGKEKERRNWWEKDGRRWEEREGDAEAGYGLSLLRLTISLSLSLALPLSISFSVSSLRPSLVHLHARSRFVSVDLSPSVSRVFPSPLAVVSLAIVRPLLSV